MFLHLTPRHQYYKHGGTPHRSVVLEVLRITNIWNTRFEVLMAVNIKITLFWDVKPYNLIHPEMIAAGSSETI
jgi:hypothetical protein